MHYFFIFYTISSTDPLHPSPAPHLKTFKKFTIDSKRFTQYCAGGKIEKNEMGWACGAYGGGERCTQGSGEET